MPYSSLALAIAAAACLPWTSFASANHKAIGMEFQKVKAPRTIVRRDGSAPVILENHKKLYIVRLQIGTPPQDFQVTLDTGSSDLFVPSNSEDFCLLHQNECSKTGVYDTQMSSTSKNLHLPFEESFGDNSFYSGGFFRDTVRFGGATMEKVRFGVADTTADVTIGNMGVDGVGLMGVGFEANEAGINQGQPPYPNIVSSLRTSGAIGSRAFSLYINSQDAAAGIILFGGVDSSLYTGPLTAVPMIKEPGKATQREFAVSCTSFTASSSSDGKADPTDLSNNALPAYVLLDSGGEASQLPPDLFAALQQSLQAKAGADGEYYAPCDLATSTASFSFGFGGPTGATIVTPAGAFIKANDPATHEECGSSHCCALSVSPSPDGFILGDDFLHSAYLVFDVDNEVIALAQANLSPSTEKNVHEIRSGLHGIPGAVYSSAGNSSDNSTAIGTAGSTASGAVASATGGFRGNVTATGIQPLIAGFTGAADRMRMEGLMLGAAVGLGALLW